MLHEAAISKLLATGQDLYTPKKIDVPNDGSKAHFYINGAVEDFEVPPARRKHEVDSVADLIAAASTWKDSPVVWVDQSKVVLVTDDKVRRDSVTLPLRKSSAFQTIESLKNTKHFGQPELIRLLRVEFRKAAGAAEILAAVRKIKFRQSSEGHADIQHGSESLGKAIENQVSGAGSIPELLIVPTNVYANPGEEGFVFEIGLDLEIDVTNQRFSVRPIPDEIEHMTAMALGGIYTRINEALPDVPIFYGRP